MWHLARVLPVPGQDREDAVSVALYGLTLAIRGYREGRGANFTTFADQCARRKLLNARKVARRHPTADRWSTEALERVPALTTVNRAAVLLDELEERLDEDGTRLLTALRNGGRGELTRQTQNSSRNERVWREVKGTAQRGNDAT